MTPRSVQVGLVRWCRVTSTNAITGRAVALTLASARAALPCGPDEAVVSAASYALGTPRGARLAAVLLCSLCVKPLPEDRHADGMHVDCRARWQRGYDARQARLAKDRARKVAARKAESVRRRKAAQLREAWVRAGVKRRREKRGAV